MGHSLRRAFIEDAPASRAIETGFPLVEITHVAEVESWRKEINRPLYHIHKWWATRLGSIFRAITLASLSPHDSDIWADFYKIHDLQGKVVLDPFMGSGTTLGEALKLGCKVVGCDINPVSTFLVRQALTRVDETCLRQGFSSLEQEVAPEIRHYYETLDPETGERIPVLYYFWVMQVETPEGETIPLFSDFVFSKDAYPKKKPTAQIICPECWRITQGRHDTTDLKCTWCRFRFNPQEGPAQGQYVASHSGKRYKIKDLINCRSSPPEMRMYALMALRRNGEKFYLSASEADLALYQEAEGRLSRENLLQLPTMDVRSGHNTDQARGYHYLRWRDFFNARQLLCLGILLRAILRIEDKVLKEQFLCLFSSTLEFNNMFCSFKGEGTGAVRHMFSHHILKPERAPLENSIWGTDRSSGTFSTLFESRLLRAKRYLDAPFEVQLDTDLFGHPVGSGKIVVSKRLDAPLVDSWEALIKSRQAALVLNGDSANLPIPDRAVDAIITDPPYFDFVHYSELSDFFFAWLAPALRGSLPYFERKDSSHSGEVQHKDPHYFAVQLGRVFSECHRVLKDDGVLVFTFHHSRAEGWAAIYEAVVVAGFEIAAAHPVHAELRAASPKAAAKEPISLDAIVVCKKRSRAERGSFNAADTCRKANELAQQLELAGMRLTTSDKLVILASQVLVGLKGMPTPFDEVCRLVRALETELSQESRLE
jgi:putative DNA methylase